MANEKPSSKEPQSDAKNEEAFRSFGYTEGEVSLMIGVQTALGATAEDTVKTVVALAARAKKKTSSPKLDGKTGLSAGQAYTEHDEYCIIASMICVRWNQNAYSPLQERAAPLFGQAEWLAMFGAIADAGLDAVSVGAVDAMVRAHLTQAIKRAEPK